VESLQPRRTMFAARTLITVSQGSRNARKDVLSMFLTVDNVGAKRMSSGRLFQATGPATQMLTIARCLVVGLGSD